MRYILIICLFNFFIPKDVGSIFTVNNPHGTWKFSNYEHYSSPLLLNAPTYQQFGNYENINTVYVNAFIDTAGTIYIDSSGFIKTSYFIKNIYNLNNNQNSLKVIRDSKWEPAKYRGQNISTWVTIPISEYIGPPVDIQRSNENLRNNKLIPYDKDAKKRFSVSAISKRANAQYRALIKYNNKKFIVVKGDSIDGGVIDRITAEKVIFQINGKYRDYYLDL